VQTPVPWLSEVLAVIEEIMEVCQEISDKVSDLQCLSLSLYELELYIIATCSSPS